MWTHPDPTNGLRSVTLVCGGIAEDEGQKVHNQRAAFRELTVRDAIVAFADADILCDREWLARLAAPINRGSHELSTTYRWLVPRRPTLPNQLASVINASITTQGGAEWSTVLWGGSMAMTRTVFDEIDAPNLLAGSLNDDLRLSKAARATGRRIAFVRSLILPTSVDFTWRSFFEFVKRQYTQLKFFSPILYTGVNFVLGFYVLGAATIVAAIIYGYFYAWLPVLVACFIDQFRAFARQLVCLSLFKDNGIRQKLFATVLLEHMFTPLWIGLHWLLLASTWTQSRLTWAGVRYRILSKSKTRILARDTTVLPLPAGAPGLAMIGALHDRRRPTAPPPAPTTPPAETVPSTEAVAEIPAESGAPDLAATPPAAPQIPIPHPGAPSAILPLTANFHSRRRRPLPLDAPKRPPLPAIERLLRKTRLRPATLLSPPTESAPATDPLPTAPPPPAAEPSPTFDAASVAPRRLRSAAELAMLKTRLSGKAESASPLPVAPPRPHPDQHTTVARLVAKTRLLPPSPPLSPSPPLLLSPSQTIPSHAAHRPGPGLIPRRGLSPRRLLARSGRPLPAARLASPPAARPVSRGPSARP